MQTKARNGSREPRPHAPVRAEHSTKPLGNLTYPIDVCGRDENGKENGMRKKREGDGKPSLIIGSCIGAGLAVQEGVSLVTAEGRGTTCEQGNNLGSDHQGSRPSALTSR